MIPDSPPWGSLRRASSLWDAWMTTMILPAYYCRSSPSLLVWWEVVTWLPTRMVGRLTQVSREWRAMTKDEVFIDKHWLHANLNKSPQVMFSDVEVGSFKLAENLTNTSEQPPMVDGDAVVVCSKPCRGLNAGSFAGYDFVCNPATGYYKVIRLGLGGAGTGVPRTAVLQNDIARRLAAKHMEEEEEMCSLPVALALDATRRRTGMPWYTERNMETRA
jgi:hypothetical protein